MIEIKAKELNAGEEFSYGGREFVALGWEQNGVLAVANETNIIPTLNIIRGSNHDEVFGNLSGRTVQER